MPRLVSRSALLAVLVLSIICFGACNADNQTASTNSAAPATSPAASPAGSPTTATNTPRAKLNVNTASGQEFMNTIPNFNNRMVHEFEEYRPYRSIQVFRREIGKYVAPSVVAEYEKYIFVPIDINQADAPTLMQIPGLDQSEAEAMIAGRPYASADAFLTRLSDKVSADERETARSYLSRQ
jgi:DNA uptake protein ComE-like DNA-binding protein